MTTTSTTAERNELRVLRDADFNEIYHCDRFTARVIANRFRYISDDMSTQLQATAFSPVIRDANDFAATIVGPPDLGWATPSPSNGNTLFFASASNGVKVALEEFGLDRLRPGDVIVVNDNYRVGTHTNDVSFMKPLFYQGCIVSVLNIVAHQLDFGGRIFGGFDITKASTYEDGLVLPPMLLYREGERDLAMFKLIADNTRLPDVVLPDIESLVRVLDLGEQLVLETVERYGEAAYRGAIRYACDAAAEAMSEALVRIPDGDYDGEQILDGDGLPNSPEYAIRVRISKRGHRAEVDFSGTSKAARTCLNCTWGDVMGAVAVGFKWVFDPFNPFASGVWRDIDILAPAGSVVNALPPSSNQYYFDVFDAVTKTVLDALNKAAGEAAIAPDAWSLGMHTAHGVDGEGNEWFSDAVASVRSSNPWGATQSGDGDGTGQMVFNNLSDPGVEQTEAGAPVVVIRRELLADSGGPGYNRGGAAGLTDSLWLEAGDHEVFNTHCKRPPGAANGGSAGILGGTWLFPPDVYDEVGAFGLPDGPQGEVYRRAEPLAGVLDPATHLLDATGEYYCSGASRPVPANSVLRYIANGAGGWGDPLEREPERVLRDVRDEYLTIEQAAAEYGVVIEGDPANDPEGLKLDQAAGEALRARLRASRVAGADQ